MEVLQLFEGLGGVLHYGKDKKTNLEELTKSENYRMNSETLFFLPSVIKCNHECNVVVKTMRCC